MKEVKKRSYILVAAATMLIVSGISALIWHFVGSHVPVAVQTVNDLADDIRRDPVLLDGLQPWCIETLARYREGKVRTLEGHPHQAIGDVSLAPEEVPTLIRSHLRSNPVVTVLLDRAGQPEAIAIQWYLYGIVAGPPEYRLTIEPWCYVEVRPGIYTYYLYK